jgi:hypothetical protein
METTKKLACLGSLTVCLIAPTIALADNCTGHFSNTTVSTDSIEIEKGYTLTFFHARGNATSENSVHNGVGMCGGYALTTPDGKTKLVGICTRKGKDGGWSDAWSLEPGAERGEWHMVAGTGVYAGKKNKGWWQGTVGDGKTDMGNWGGDCQ